MIIKELIEKLMKYPEDMPIVFGGDQSDPERLEPFFVVDNSSDWHRTVHNNQDFLVL